ncbi:reverse transcriptase N-terminal domain-containing protein [Photobacterium lipolyticum]|uniref:reverse transcriptase N-terminal domain-containing protein n=1 Tax=Photobacterium lipolyticum TaxID=266810 RepID=UPI001FE8FA07|nr:reverse transcriptase N-terminal domain-containing protein [Photobacterium lipolyticum]
MISKEISASPDSAQWQSIDWKSVESHVLKLQVRIAKATREGKHGKAKAGRTIIVIALLNKYSDTLGTNYSMRYGTGQ